MTWTLPVRALAVAALLVAALLGGDPAAAAPRIDTVDLPIPAGYSGYAEDINASGQVAGALMRGTTGRPVRWDGDTRVDLPVGASTGGGAIEINDAGTVAGFVGGGPGTINYARLWRADGSVQDCAAGGYFTELIRLNERDQTLFVASQPTGGGSSWVNFCPTAGWVPPTGGYFPRAYAIDDQGRAAGGSVFVAQRQHLPTVVQPGADPLYLPIPEGTYGQAYDFGQGGVVVGALGQSVYGSSNGVWGFDLVPEQAVLWVGNRMVRLGTLGGPTSAPLKTGRGVNRIGDIVGTSVTASGQTHGFRWRLGRMTDLGTLGGPSRTPVAVNDLGQIVGTSTTRSGETHAFLWTGGQMVDLTPGETASTATAINNRGQIVGSITTADGTRPVKWTVRRG
jgi:probable HAF family extracellular repeat protein